MKKIVLLCGALLTLTAVAANAQLHLTTVDCGGGQSATWTCTSSTGTAFTVIASVNAPPLTTLTAEEGVLEVAFNNPVPAWWQSGAGKCRVAGAFTVAYSGGAYSCVDYFGTVSSVVGSNSYQIGPDAASGDPNGPIDANRVRIRTLSAVDYDAALATPPPAVGDEIFLFSLSVNKSKTTGTGACAGCLEPACMVFKQVKLNQPAGIGDPVVGTPLNYGYVMLQGSVATDCPSATPASRSSWGQVKSLYR